MLFCGYLQSTTSDLLTQIRTLFMLHLMEVFFPIKRSEGVMFAALSSIITRQQKDLHLLDTDHTVSYGVRLFCKFPKTGHHSCYLIG